jgi:hypothetical protein
MGSTIAASQYPVGNVAKEQVVTAPSATNAKIRLNKYVAIFSLAALLALATAAECQSFLNPGAFSGSLLYGAVLWLWWGVAASAMWQLGKRAPRALTFTPRVIAIHVLAGSALGFTHLLVLGMLGFVDPAWRTHATALAVSTNMIGINRLGIEVLLYGFVFGITGVVQFQIRAQEDALRSLALERQLSAAHLQALQMQLEPHFLFNTLNAITTLVELDRQKQAAEMLSRLTAILRSTLKRSTPEKVPLAQELEIIENYLAIEQVRFADRLRIEIKVDPSALDGLVPCFLLQPIVENAIRHGIAGCEDAGVVEASARREGQSLHLRIRDTGAGSATPKQAGHGIGLKNTRERLAHFYQDSYAMKAEPLEAGGYEVAITIPYERIGR